MGRSPTAKVASGGVAGAVTVVLLFILGLCGVAVPAEVASAVTVIITSLTSYLVTDRGEPGDGSGAETPTERMALRRAGNRDGRGTGIC